MKKKSMLPMNIQHFARPAFNPDTTTMQDAKTGAIPINISEGILTDVKNGSAAMKLAKAVPMTKPIEQFTYMTGVGAYWVDEAQRIETDKPTFVKAEMRSKKMAVIIPTTKENLNYSVSNFFELMKPEIAEAFYKKFDQAVFTGVESPYQWDILKSATDASNLVDESANKYDDINLAMAKLEEEDLDANGVATLKKQRVKYRSTKDENGMPIFNTSTSSNVDNILGLPIAYTPKTSFGASKVTELVGDWNYAYYGILKGIEYEILTEATLTTVKDEEGNPLSLAERDMAAIKATFELGFMVVKDNAFAAVVEKDGAEGTRMGNTESTREELLDKFYKNNTADKFKEILTENGVDFEEISDKRKLFDLILENEIDIL